MSSAPLFTRIASILQGTGTSDPFGAVADLLSSTFSPSVGPEHPIPQLIVISIGLGICLFFSLGALVVRHRKARASGSHLVFVTVQQGFVIPGAAVFYLLGIGLWSSLSLAYVGKIIALFRHNATSRGLHEVRSMAWWFLMLTGNILIWGLKCAANLSPQVTRSMGGRDGVGGPKYYWFPPQMWNWMIVARATAWITTTFTPIIVTSVYCERFISSLGETIGTADGFSQAGLTPADQTSLSALQGQLGTMAHDLHMCKTATEAEFICYGVWSCWNVIEWCVAGYLLGTRVGGQIKVLERAVNDMRHARQRGVALERHHSRSDLEQWSKGDLDRDSMEQKNGALFPSYDNARVDPAAGNLRNGRKTPETNNSVDRALRTSSDHEIETLSRRIQGLKETRYNLYVQTGGWQIVNSNYLAVNFVGAALALRALTDPKILVLVTVWPFWAALLPTIPVVGALFFKSFTLDPTSQGGLLGNAVSAPTARRSAAPQVDHDSYEEDQIRLTAGAEIRYISHTPRQAGGLHSPRTSIPAQPPSMQQTAPLAPPPSYYGYGGRTMIGHTGGIDQSPRTAPGRSHRVGGSIISGTTTTRSSSSHSPDPAR